MSCQFHRTWTATVWFYRKRGTIKVSSNFHIIKIKSLWMWQHNSIIWILSSNLLTAACATAKLTVHHHVVLISSCTVSSGSPSWTVGISVLTCGGGGGWSVSDDWVWSSDSLSVTYLQWVWSASAVTVASAILSLESSCWALSGGAVVSYKYITKSMIEWSLIMENINAQT